MIAELEQKLLAEQKDVERKKYIIGQLELELKQQSQENINKQNQIQSLEETKRNLEQKNIELATNISNLNIQHKDEIAKLVAEKTKLEEQLQEKQNFIQEQKKQINELQNQLVENQNKYTELLDNFNKQAEDIKALIELKEGHHFSNEILKNLSLALKELQPDSKEKNAIVFIEQFKKLLDNLKKQIEGQKIMIQNLQDDKGQQATNNQRELANLQQELEEKNNIIDQLHKWIKKLNDEDLAGLKVLEGENENLRVENKDLQEEKDHLKAANKTLVETKLELTEKLATIRQELDATLERLKVMDANLITSKNTSLQNAQDKKALEAKVNSLEKELNLLKQRETKLNKVETDYTDLNKKFVKIQNEKAALEEQIAEMKNMMTSNTKLRNELDMVKNSNQTLENQLNAKIKQLELDKQREIQSKQDELEATKKLLENKQQELEAAKKTIEENKQTNNAYAEQLAKQVLDLKNQLQQLQQNFQNQISANETALEQKEKTISALLAVCEQQLENAKNQLLEVKEQNEQLTQQIHKLKDQNQELSKQNEKLNNERKSAIEKLIKHIDKTESNENLEQIVDRFITKQQELIQKSQKQESQLAEQEKKLTEQANLLKTQQSQLESKMSLSSEEVEKLQKQLKEQATQIQTLEKESEELKIVNRELEAKNAELEKLNILLRNQLKELTRINEKYSNQIDKMEEDNVVQEGIIKSLNEIETHITQFRQISPSVIMYIKEQLEEQQNLLIHHDFVDISLKNKYGMKINAILSQLNEIDRELKNISTISEDIKSSIDNNQTSNEQATVNNNYKSLINGISNIIKEVSYIKEDLHKSLETKNDKNSNITILEFLSKSATNLLFSINDKLTNINDILKNGDKADQKVIEYHKIAIEEIQLFKNKVEDTLNRARRLNSEVNRQEVDQLINEHKRLDESVSAMYEYYFNEKQSIISTQAKKIEEQSAYIIKLHKQLEAKDAEIKHLKAELSKLKNAYEQFGSVAAEQLKAVNGAFGQINIMRRQMQEETKIGQYNLQIKKLLDLVNAFTAGRVELPAYNLDEQENVEGKDEQKDNNDDYKDMPALMRQITPMGPTSLQPPTLNEQPTKFNSDITRTDSKSAIGSGEKRYTGGVDVSDIKHNPSQIPQVQQVTGLAAIFGAFSIIKWLFYALVIVAVIFMVWNLLNSWKQDYQCRPYLYDLESEYNNYNTYAFT